MLDLVKLRRWAASKPGRFARWAQDPLAILMRVRRVPQPDTSHRDLPRTPATMTVAIAAIERTGSSLLAERLEVTGLVGVPDEYLNTNQLATAAATGPFPELTTAGKLEQQWRRVRLRRRWEVVKRYRPESVRNYLDEVVARRTGSNGVFSIKVHAGILDLMTEWYGLDETMLPQPIQWVYLERRDRLARAVSFVRASQSGEWVKGRPNSLRAEPVRYDAKLIEEALCHGAAGARRWEEFFAERGIEPIRVVYEDLRNDIDGTRDRLLRELGLGEPDDTAAYQTSSFVRQSNEVNDEWIERFRRERPDFERIGQ